MDLNPALHLPERNEFIPTDFDIKERPADVGVTHPFARFEPVHPTELEPD